MSTQPRNVDWLGIGFCASFGVLSAGILGVLLSKPAAQPARLISYCNDQLLAAMEEDHFLQGCDWIEVIRYEP